MTRAERQRGREVCDRYLRWAERQTTTTSGRLWRIEVVRLLQEALNELDRLDPETSDAERVAV